MMYLYNFKDLAANLLFSVYSRFKLSTAKYSKIRPYNVYSRIGGLDGFIVFTVYIRIRRVTHTHTHNYIYIHSVYNLY